MVRRLSWIALGLGLVLWLVGIVPGRYIFAPLLGLLIYSVGVASFGSLRRGGASVPDGPPQAVDIRTERTIYWCAGCGAEVLLIVRGAAVAPRHCGERMTEHIEIARQP